MSVWSTASDPACDAVLKRLVGETECWKRPLPTSLKTQAFGGAWHDTPSYWATREVDGSPVRELVCVCWFECDAAVRNVPPGQYVAAWRLHISELQGFDEVAAEVSLEASPVFKRSWNAAWRASQASGERGWFLLVFPTVISVQSLACCTASLHQTDGRWKSGFGVAEFALLPVDGTSTAPQPEPQKALPEESSTVLCSVECDGLKYRARVPVCTVEAATAAACAATTSEAAVSVVEVFDAELDDWVVLNDVGMLCHKGKLRVRPRKQPAPSGEEGQRRPVPVEVSRLVAGVEELAVRKRECDTSAARADREMQLLWTRVQVDAELVKASIVGEQRMPL
eukprot:m51a1_g4471 hypothetical protein (339) ;mRNA; f:243812-244929